MTQNRYVNMTEDRRQVLLNRHDKQDITAFCIIQKMTPGACRSTYYTLCPPDRPMDYGLIQIFQSLGISDSDAMDWIGKSGLSIAREHGLPVGFWNWNVVNDFVTKLDFLITDMASGKFPTQGTYRMKYIEMDFRHLHVRMTIPDTGRHFEMRIVDIPIPNRRNHYNYHYYVFRSAGWPEKSSPFLPFELAGIPEHESRRLMRENRIRTHNGRDGKVLGLGNKLSYAVKVLETLDAELERRCGGTTERQDGLSGHVQLEFDHSTN